MDRPDHASASEDTPDKEGDSAVAGEGASEGRPIEVPDDATPAEAAAVVAAVRAHLQESQRATESAAEAATVSRWRLQSRLGRRVNRLRQPVSRGEAWKVAARTG